MCLYVNSNDIDSQDSLSGCICKLTNFKNQLNYKNWSMAVKAPQGSMGSVYTFFFLPDENKIKHSQMCPFLTFIDSHNRKGNPPPLQTFQEGWLIAFIYVF